MGNVFIKRYVLSHAHPVKFISEILGILISSYFVWKHDWILAIVSAIILFFLSTLLVWRHPIQNLEKTSLGKIMLVYSKSINFLLYNISVVPYIYGLWTHKLIYVLIGILILVLPHFLKLNMIKRTITL